MYTQPFKKVGKVDPTMKNQSKSSFYLTDVPGPGDGKKDTKKDNADTLPSYDTTTYDASTSASGNSSSSNSSSNSNLSTNNLSNYQSTLKDLGPDFKPTPEQTAAANKRVAELKALDAKNAAANASNSSQNNQSSTETRRTTTTTLGNQTLNQRLTGGNIAAQNTQNRAIAVRQNIRNEAVSDSIAAHNAYVQRAPIGMQDNPKVQAHARKRGNVAAMRKLISSKAYTPQQAKNMVLPNQPYQGQE